MKRKIFKIFIAILLCLCCLCSCRKKETYIINYELNGGTIDGDVTIQFKENEWIELPTPIKEGYRFVGWYQNGELITQLQNQNYDLVARWEQIFYIDYDLDGGILSGDAKTSFVENEIVDLPTPIKEGYRFVGWYQNGELITQLQNQNYDLVARWKQIFYIDYDLDGGILPGNARTSFIENEIVMLPIPQKDYHEFIGWYQNGELVTSITNQNYQLIAKWERVYQITYILNGGQFLEEVKYTIKSDEEYELPIPTNEGYEFIGWFNQPTFTGSPIISIASGTNQDIKLYAFFEKIYSITYIIEDGVMPDEYIRFYHPEKGEQLPIPTRDGYTFVGWAESTTSIRTMLIVPISYEEDLILYPRWEKVTYSIHYQFPDQIFASKEHLFIAFFTDFYNYIVEYRNENEYLKNNGVKTLQDFLSIAGNWTGGASGMGRIGNLAGKFYLKIDINGDIHNQTADDGFIGYCLENNKYVEFVYFLQEFFYWWRLDEGYTGGPDDPENHGSDFLASAWASLVDTAKFFYFEKDTLPSYFISKGHVPAMYDKIPYIVKMENMDLKYEYDWEVGYTLPSQISIEGYHFLGWYDHPECIGNPITYLETNIYHDITLYALLEKLYQVELETNGGQVESEKIYFSQNEKVNLPIPTKDGYQFRGWYDNQNCLGNPVNSIPKGTTADQKLYALWEKKTYTITYHYGINLYPSKTELFKAFFTEFYHYIVDYRGASSALISQNIYSVNDFLSIASDWDAGRGQMRHIGDVAATYYLKKDPYGDIDNQTAEDGFIGYCLENNLFVDLVYFLQEFFYWWRLDEGYTTSTNNGSDFLNDVWASLVDTAKFFYFEKNTLPSYFIAKEHIPSMYDRIPHIIDISNIVFEKTYDWEVGITIVQNLTREGYTFLGWYDNEEYIGEAITQLEPNIFHNIDLYAKWEKIDN